MRAWCPTLVAVSVTQPGVPSNANFLWSNAAEAVLPTRRLRLLHLLRTLNPSRGGSVNAARQFSPAVVKLGHSVEVATLDAPDAPWLSNFPVPLHVLGPARGSYGYKGDVVSWLRQHANRYDAVIVEGLWQYHGLATWRALHGRTPYFVFVHGMLDPWFRCNFPLKHAKKRLYWSVAEGRVLHDAAAVLFTSERERELAGESFGFRGSNTAITPLGIEDPGREDERQRIHFLSSFSELKGKRIVLYLGRVHPIKGCDLLIEAFASTLAHDSSWQLVIAGPEFANWSNVLQNKAATLGISGRITWTGMLEGDLKWGAYRAAEVFSLPSHSENFGFTIAEALACGLPVLITDKVNIWPDIAEAEAGFVDTDSVTGTANLLRRWELLDDAGKSQMRQRARECFVRRYTIEGAAAHFAATLGRLSVRSLAQPN